MAINDFGAVDGLIGSIIEMLLFGIFIPIAFSCTVIFHRKYKASRVNVYQFITFLTISLLCTVRLIIDTHRTVFAFLNPLPDGTVLYGALNSPLSLFTNSLWVVETVVADMFIIWRVWVVWGKSWRMVLLPALLLMGSAAGGAFQVYIMSTYGSATSGAFSHDINLGSNLFAYFTLFLNLVCTSCICYKIWFVRRNISGTRVANSSDPVQRMIGMIVESAAIYTVLLLAVIITISSGKTLAFIFLDMIPPTIAIVFSSIILRSNQGLTFGDTSNLTTSGPTTARTVHSDRGVLEFHSRTGGKDEATRTLQAGVQIHLDKMVTSKVDGEESVHNNEASLDKFHKDDV